MYNRLFSKILDSSIWLEPDSTRIVWFTLLASMDQDGYCHYSALENLASRARVSVAKTRKSIECFMSPDPDSENQANEGRRIERVPGGYLVLNAEYYRNKFTREIEREQTRLRVARHRAKNDLGSKQSVTKALHSVSPVSVSSSESVCKRKPKNLEEVLKYASQKGISESDATAFFDSMEAGGWTRNGKALKDWEAHLRSYKANAWLPSQKQSKNGRPPAMSELDKRLDRDPLWQEQQQKRKIA